MIEPEILLLDEPLSTLGKKMREEMKFWIENIQKSVGITTIYVTHDQSEALTMSDRIAVMDRDRVPPIGSPVEIYEQPASRFIAEFIGDSNLLKGRIETLDGSACSVNLGAVSVPGRLSANSSIAPGQDIALLVHPETIRLHPIGAEERPKLARTVSETIYQGSVVRCRVQADGKEMMVEVANRPDLLRLETGDTLAAYWNAASGVVIR